MKDIKEAGRVLVDYLADWDDDGFIVDARGRPVRIYVEDSAVQTLSLESEQPNQYALDLIGERHR